MRIISVILPAMVDMLTVGSRKPKEPIRWKHLVK